MLSEYEKQALLEIENWKNPEKNWLKKVAGAVNKPLDYAGEAVMNTPFVGDVLKKAMKGVLDLANDAAQWSVDLEAILKEFRGDGHDVNNIDDIVDLNLKDIDDTVGWLAAKYKSILFTEGAASGAMGAAGIVVDVPALMVGCLRAVGEYATYYGFDVTHQSERLYALNVLGYASSPTDASKSAAMAQLVKISGSIGRKTTWRELEKSAFVRLVQEIAKSLGIRLTKAKLAQVVPVLGSVAGGGFNTYYTSKVCEAAHNLYRERFLMRKMNSMNDGEIR